MHFLSWGIGLEREKNKKIVKILHLVYSYFHEINSESAEQAKRNDARRLARRIYKVKEFLLSGAKIEFAIT